MARRSDHTKEELFALAINKAIEIVDENGLSGFSARQVSKRMKYTVGTLYHTFGDLDNFMLNVKAHILDEWYILLTHAVKKSPGSGLKSLTFSYINFAKKYPGRWSIIFDYTLPHQTQTPDWYSEKVTRMFKLIEEHLSPLLSKEEDVNDAAKVFWASIHGICVLSLTGKLARVNAKKAEELTEKVLQLYTKKD